MFIIFPHDKATSIHLLVFSYVSETDSLAYIPKRELLEHSVQTEPTFGDKVKLFRSEEINLHSHAACEFLLLDSLAHTWLSQTWILPIGTYCGVNLHFLIAS